MDNKLCLIVDDSSVVRKISRAIFEGLNFNVIEAENGKQAIELVARKLPQVVLLDWNMPVMNGIEFLNLLRKEYNSDVVKVIFCTTENDIVKIMAAMEAGANEYIMKPFNEEIIKTKLTQMRLI